jgi:hypothetical protein
MEARRNIGKKSERNGGNRKHIISGRDGGQAEI